MKEISDDLRMRWKSGFWKEKLDAILVESARTTHVISAEFLWSLNTPQFEGRLDLRGIPFFEPIDPPMGGHDKFHLRLRGSEYKNMDFSHADMKVYVGDTTIKNCLFRESNMVPFRIWECQISQCDFSRAFMPWFEAGRGTQIVESVFDHSKIRHHASAFGYASFELCSFRDIDWRMFHFRGCRFTDCTFTGHLQKSYAEPTFSSGFDAIRDYCSKVKYHGHNVFVRCNFDKLKVTRFSVKPKALTLEDCTGFPTYSLPSNEGHLFCDFYSDNAKPKPIP
jgi:uncharacterized protein YjbI with pentapeptide repeats